MCEKNDDNVSFLKVAAPMVRYSKWVLVLSIQLIAFACIYICRLAFRKTVRNYGADVAYTPMFIASSFAQSAKCRDGELTMDESQSVLDLLLQT